MDEFKKIAYPIKARANFHNDFPVYQQQFQNFSQEIGDKLSVQTTLADQTIQDILSKQTEMFSFFNVISQLLASKQPYEDIGHSIEEVQIKFESFKQTINTLFNTPPPKAEPPKEQQ